MKKVIHYMLITACVLTIGFGVMPIRGFSQEDADAVQNEVAEFEVSESDYYSLYQDNPEYELVGTVDYYRYATRTKSTSTSGYDTKSGWIKYDTKTTTSTSGYAFGTPPATQTSYANNKRTVTSAVDTGYYYYAYVVADPSKTSDWCYYADKTRAKVISHMKANFSQSSTWAESRLRYFWYISPKDLGAMSGKLKKTIPYCADSSVSVGTLSQTGTHYYDISMYRYKQCYKVRTVVTVNYFYQWSDWAWSDWTTTRKSITNADTMKEETQVRYIVRGKTPENPTEPTAPTEPTEPTSFSGGNEDGPIVSIEENKTDINTCTLQVTSKREFVYTGTAFNIAFRLTDTNPVAETDDLTETNHEKLLTEGVDYTVRGNYGVNAGNYNVVITGINDYSGTRSVTFTIKKATPVLKYAKASMSAAETDTVKNQLIYTKGLSVTEKTSDKKKAEVKKDGILVKKRGTVTVTASTAGNRNYNAGSAQYKLTITPIKYSWPTKGHKIYGNWGKEAGHYQKYHYGIDIGASSGSKIKAAAPGRVIRAKLYSFYGYTVIIKHANGQCTLYAHNKKLKVRKNDIVKRGTVIALAGGTGSGGKKAYPVHCHFGIYKSKKALSKEFEGVNPSKITINPKKVLKK